MNSNVLIWVLLIIFIIVICFEYNNEYLDKKLNSLLSGIDKHSKLIVYIIFSVNLLIKLIYVFNIDGYNQDEISQAYDAYSLLNYGVDRTGYTFPIYSLSWGSGQNVLYMYILIPFIKLFGIDIFIIRFPMIIISMLAMYYFYKLLKLFLSERAAMGGLIFYCLLPWNYMGSVWAVESNLFPFMIIIGFYFIVSSYKKPINFIIGTVIFGFSLYSYAISYIAIPSILICCYYLMIKYKKVNWKYFFIGNFLLFLLALPLVIFLFINFFDLPEIRTSFFSIPKLTFFRTDELMGISNILNITSLMLYIALLFGILTVWPFVYLTNYGVFYLISLMPFFYSFLYSYRYIFKKNIKDRFIKDGFIFKSIVACTMFGFLVVVFVKPGTLRSNFTYFFLTILIYIGYLYMSKFDLKKIVFTFSLISLLFFTFTFNFLYLSRDYYKETFSSGLMEALTFAEESTDEIIYTCVDITMPYIYVLYKNKIPVYEFLDSFKYHKEDCENYNLRYLSVKSFNNYIFHLPEEINSSSSYVVCKNEKLEILDKFNYMKYKDFDNFRVYYN